jgi:3-methyl-2-oxobutanoate hydroxymethyltransferase
MNINDFQTMKKAGKKISMITCYDYWSASIIAYSDVDCILVGDSLAMIMHGHATTIPATVELMELHTQAVARGAKNKFIITDVPFLAHRKGLVVAMRMVEKFLRAGAQAIKLERAEGNEELIKHIIESGVPVMGHVGMTPQSIHQLGGFYVQGRQEQTAQNLLMHALALQDMGCFAIVLECVPSAIAQSITEQLTMPTIGIGAGPQTDGQVLVLQDILGVNQNFNPKFLKTYLNGFSVIQMALNDYNRDVKGKKFPAAEHCYS